MRIAVIDGQGGGIGRAIVDRLRRDLPEETEIIALGTNALAASLMLKAGANDAASGENAIIYAANKVDIIAGPIGIIIANSMLGELTPAMASAIADADAAKMLIPLSRTNVTIMGVHNEPLPHFIKQLSDRISVIIQEKKSGDDKNV